MVHLVLVNGLPGVGKTTLANKLSKDLAMPCMGKDMLKEFFFDTLGVDGRETSRMLGRAATETLYVLADQYLAANTSLMLECPFFAEFARPRIAELQRKYQVRIIEVYCHVDARTRRERYQKRIADGERHEGHTVASDLSRLTDTDPEPYDTYAPLEVGEVIMVDTAVFGDAEYQELLETVKHKLEDSYGSDKSN